MFTNLAIVNGGPTLYSYFLCFWYFFRKSLLFEGGFNQFGAGKFPPYDFGIPKFNIMHQLCYIYIIYLFIHIVLKYIEIHGSRMFKSFKSIKTHRHKSIITSIWIHKKNMIQSIEIQGVALPVFFFWFLQSLPSGDAWWEKRITVARPAKHHWGRGAKWRNGMKKTWKHLD